jgi:hypothetical protein
VNSKTDGDEWQSHRAIHGLRVDLLINFLMQNVSVLCKDSVRNAQWTHYVSVLKIIQLVLYKAKVAVCSEIHTEHIHCGQKVELFSVKPSETQSKR